MPYREPHRTVRARIIDLEIMKLELRRRAHSQPPLPGDAARPTDRRAESARRAAS